MSGGGVIAMIAECWGCRTLFTSNPNLVPSIRVLNGKPDPAGTREPLCRSCIERVNELRVRGGLPPFVIHPNAYEAEEL